MFSNSSFILLRPASRLLSSLTLVAALLALGGSVRAASRFWDGSANGNFGTAANWVGGVAPVAGDDLVFQAGVTQLLVTNNFSPNRAFNTILFQGSNYFVRGNALILTNGINSLNPAGPNHIDADVEVRASQPWEASGSLAVLDINGDINLNANTLTVRANTGDFFFSGIVSGTGNLVKTNVGTLRLDGAGHNTYSGFTRFDGGVLELDKLTIFPAFTNFTAIPGALTVGDGNNLVGTDVLRLLTDDQIADTSSVTVKNSGRMELNGNSDRIASLTVQGGTIDTGAGVLILGGNVASVGDAHIAEISGNLSLGGASRTFNLSPGGAAPDLRITAVISAGTSSPLFTAGIIKEGAGTLELGATNTYNGVTSINDGQLAITADRALGATATILGGSAGTVINGDANLFLSNVQVTNEALTINGVNGAGNFNCSGASVWTGNILLNSDTFLGGSGSLLLNGAISGVGGFTKIGAGAVTLAGTNANPYSGTTTVRDGTLLLGKDTTEVVDGALSGPLVIGEDELPENTDVVRHLACCQLPDDTDVTINASGLLDLNGFGENVRDITFNGGDLDAPSPGSILPIGDIIVNRNTNSQAILSGRMSLLSNPIIDVTGHFFSPDLRITAQLFGTGGFTKNGLGEVGLSAANLYSGLTTVNDGFVLVDHSLALGSTANGTVVKSGAVLALRFGVDVPAEALTLAGTGQSVFGALSSSFGSNSWAGTVTLSSNATISVDTGDFLNLLGSVTGGFDVIKTGTGTLLFSGGTANNFDGLFVNSGTLVFAKTLANAAGPASLTIGDGSGTDLVRLALDNQLADETPLNITISGRFDLNDMVETTGAIVGRGVIDLGSGSLREGADDGSSTFTGGIIGTGSLFKFGSGTWTLTGNNTYTGPTTVSAGTLVINGSQPQSPVIVNGTATLMGDGVVGNLQVFGSVAPGSSPAILTCSNVAFASQGDYFVELNGTTVGTGYDQLNARGTNQLGGSTLHVEVGPAFAPAEGERFTIVNNDGSDAIFGTFNGLANGSLLTAGGLQFRILYSDIFLNDVILVVTNTPLKLATAPTVETGNGNGEIEPGECNLLRIVLMNKLGAVVGGVSATLSSTNPGVTVTQPFSTYPNLPAGGMATNNTPFQISTVPSLVCGTNIDLELTVHTAANGNFRIPIRLYTGAAGNAIRFNNTSAGGTAIPDLGTIDLPVNVAGITSPLHHVTVSLHLTHTTDNNLDLSLIAPDGTIIDLSSDNGGTLQDYGLSCNDGDRTVFSDNANTAITSAAAPFRGTFRPEEPLSLLRGKYGSNVNGIWRLRITDDSGGGLGTFFCWSLFVTPTLCTPGGGECDPPCPGCPVRLDIAHNPSDPAGVLLKWSTAAVGYNLVATNALKSPPNAVSPVGPPPVVVLGKYTVTNSASGTARFYELRKP